MNREDWLSGGVKAVTPLFKQHGYTVPDKLRISCGWPSIKALGRKSRRIGECWATQCSKDGTWEIFISPALSHPTEVMAVVVHEVVHTVVGLKCGHKGAFRSCALKVGLVGKMTETIAGPELTQRLNALIKDLGAYPHAALTGASRDKKQGTRLIKVECHDCGYTLRTTQKWIDCGLPTCCCGGNMHCESEEDED